MTPQQIFDALTTALTAAGFVVYDSDDRLTPSDCPGDAIAYLFHDQVELYLVNGRIIGPDGTMAADKAAAAIHNAGLFAGGDTGRALLNSRVIVTAA